MIRVLLADAHIVIREGIKWILSDVDNLVVSGEASNSAEVLALVANQVADLLVLDPLMPGDRGLELIELVKQKKPTLPILIFSTHLEECYVLHTQLAGASGYLAKDSDCEVLISVIRKVAAGGVHVNDRVAELLARERMTNTGELPQVTRLDREFQTLKTSLQMA